MTTTIVSIKSLPDSPYNNTGCASIVITSGVPSFFRIIGSDLDKIISFNWYPEDPASVQFEIRKIILVDNTLGTFMVTVTDNFLNTNDRGGRLSFRLDDGTTLNFPVITYGRVSLYPMWSAPDSGLITG